MNRVLIICITFIITSKVEAQSSTLPVLVADSLYRVGNYSKAIKVYEQSDAEIYATIQIAKAYKALGNSTKAIKYYEQALAVDSLNILVLYDYGKLLFATGKLYKSLTIFEKLNQKDTLNPNFHYQIGLVKQTLMQEDFIDSYELVFQLDSQHQKNIYKLIVYNLKRQNFEETETFITAGLKNNAEDLKVIGFNAQLFYAKKQYRKALLWFEKIINRKKATQYVYEKAAFAAYRISKISKAITYYEEALKRSPENYFYHSQLAKLYYQDENFKKVKYHAFEAIDGKKIDASGDYYILGLVAFDRKEHGKAMKLFKIALKENPEYEAAQFQLALCADSYYSDIKEKLKMYELFLKKFPEAKLDKKRIVRVRISELKSEIHTKGE